MMSMDAPRHRIREVRLSKGLSQQRLAEMLGMERTDVVRLELRTLDPRISTLQRIASALGCDVGELLR